MKRYTLTIVALVSFVNVICHAEPRALLTRHVREATVYGQAKPVGRLPTTETVRIEIVLPLRHRPELENFLHELYDRTSLSYRHFLTVEQFTERFGPSQEDYDAVIDFVKANGLTVASTSRNRMNVGVTGSVETIEKALHVTMGLYRHPTENRTFYAPDREPTVDLPFPLWHIAGLDNYSIPRPLYKRGDATAQPNAIWGSGPDSSFLGSDMRAAYYGGSSLDGTGQSLGLFEFHGIDISDLYEYYSNAGQSLNAEVILVSTDGTTVDCYYADGCDDTEQTLDITQAAGMAPNLSRLVVYVGATDVAIYNAMATIQPLNAQLSCSWAYAPADPQSADPYFQEFAAQGQSFFAAAGDWGAWSSSVPVYPADDVYVTSVGGTDLYTQYAGGPWLAETAWSDSGGGISPDLFALPFWQSEVIDAGCTDCSEYYRNGPDIAANANFSFYVCADQNGCTANQLGGTSFAAPMWAGYLALANQAAAAAGKPPIGFANPALYYFGLGPAYSTFFFNDISSGSNNVYSATPGFDLVTGWGSPKGQDLVYALAGEPGFTLSASPASLSVVQGNSGNSTISAVINVPQVLLYASIPSGVSASFSPTSLEPGVTSSVMRLTVASSTPPGQYPITVTGNADPFIGTTTVMLTVIKAPPNFTLSASSSGISVARSSSGTATITTVISGGFDSAITLSASGEGSRNTVTFSPKTLAKPGAGTSTMTVKVGPEATLGRHAMSITAKGGGVTRTIPFTLDVLP